ncbi:Ig-like domain-containing protein, partial [Streptomyces sp. NPDC051776]|uniref:beta strand repeat-containing protein n=1 Tax=Streptomyces sp. NPDC051776 TaxID=3155414 RepID=UPI0034277697
MAGTLTLVSSTPNPTVFGQTVGLTATVIPLGLGTPTGTVTFTISGGPTLTAPLVAGKASVSTTALTTGPRLITATYSGNANFASSKGTTIHAVVQALTKTTVTTAPNPSGPGQPVTLSATVTAEAPGSGTPTGNVTFFVVGGPTLRAPLVNGRAVVSTTDLGPGNRTVIATYHGDSNFFPSVGTGTHTGLPAKAATTTTVTSDPNPSVTGQPVAFTATVTPAAPGTGAPTGTVTFTISGGPTLTAPVVAGRATVSTSALTAGPHGVTAVYSGDAVFASSTGTITQTVLTASTTTTVTSAPDPSVVGEPVTFTATVAPVAPGSGVPTGTVAFIVSGGPTLTAPVVGGQASVTTNSLTVGSHTVSAAYGGDTTFAPSAGTDAHTVQPQPVASTTITVISSPDPSAVGEPVTFNATVEPVAPASGVPTGTVVFDFGDGATTSTVLSGGTAVVTHTYTAAAGNYLVTAVYGGDAAFASSLGTDTHTVGQAATAMMVTSSPDPSVFGQDVTFTATVTSVPPDAGVPTGDVVFTVEGAGIFTVPLTAGGMAVLTLGELPAGSLTVTSDYGGDAKHTPSTGTDTHTVGQAGTETTVTSSPDPSLPGQEVTFQATVTPLPPGAGVPTGDVVFTVSGGPTLTGALVNGVATVTTSALSAGPHTVTAAYQGDAGFAPSTGTGTHTVTGASTTTTVTSSPDPSVFGQSVTFTAVVSPVAPATGVPTGAVTFDLGGDVVTASLDSNGVATVTDSTLPAGSYSVTAAYGGDAEYGPSTGTDTHTVGRAPTTTVATSDPDPSVFGEAVTFTAAVAPVAPGAGTPTGTVT